MTFIESKQLFEDPEIQPKMILSEIYKIILKMQTKILSEAFVKV